MRIWGFIAAAAILARPVPSEAVDFATQVHPVLASRCAPCHSGAKPAGGLSLTTRAQALAGGTNGPAIVPGQAGQSLLETALVMPLMLLVVLNVINLGYFFVVAVNVAAAPRTGVEYGIKGFSTPGSPSLPQAGPPSGNATVSYLSQQDLTGAIYNPTSASLQVCTQVLGLNGSGANQAANCTTCTGSTCGSVGTGSPGPAADPEAPLFILHRVDTTYTLSPLIPGTPFGLALLPIPVCRASGGNVNCVFHRQVSMRAMN